jgi:protein O-GlcNAc transferase
MMKAEAKLKEGLYLHQKGQLIKAQMLYEEALKLQPDCFDALHMLGLVAYQNKNLEIAN